MRKYENDEMPEKNEKEPPMPLTQKNSFVRLKSFLYT
jgi:hypothetical protein